MPRINPYVRYMGKEDQVQNAVIKYVERKYNVKPIPMNLESNKTRFEQFKSKFLGFHRGIPDIFIPKPAKGYAGLFLELKADGVKVLKKDGSLRKDPHLEIQNRYHETLRGNSYCAFFACGFEEARKLIDLYFEKKL